MKIELRPIPTPAFSFPQDCPVIPSEEYQRRLEELYARAKLDWVAVYGDREHIAGLFYLVNYDPRFEEGLLLLGPAGKRFLIVGNEGMGYLSVLPLPVTEILNQSLSLMGQPRGIAARLSDTFKTCGIQAGQSVGMVGWKYLEPFECDDPSVPAFVPAFYLDTLRKLVGSGGKVLDVTALLMHPESGMMASVSAHQIAISEWAARNASAAVFHVLRAARPGMSEMDAMKKMHFMGNPFTMHPIVTSGKGDINGLRSPSAKKIEYGDGISVGLGYRGSLSCRAGVMLGEVDQAFFRDTAAPYFKVIAVWYASLRLGTTGDEIFQIVARTFEGSGMRSSLNPGHLTLSEEWLHSPIRPGSTEKLSSGMLLQSDIIPTPLPVGKCMNCEDTLALADAGLRAEVRTLYPEVWQRIQARRVFMQEQLGLHLAEEVLPLSDVNAYLPPFWLLPELVCVAAG